MNLKKLDKSREVKNSDAPRISNSLSFFLGIVSAHQNVWSPEEPGLQLVTAAPEATFLLKKLYPKGERHDTR